ncbi:MAG: TolB family protein [Chloroflexaceae bacterium]
MAALLLIPPLVLFSGGCSRGVDGPETAGTNPAVRGDALPGRLLFVRQGVIWQWRGREAAPLLGGGAAFQPAWDPAGERIAYIVRDNSFSDVWLADGAGRSLTRLTDNGSQAPPNSLTRVTESRWAFYPAWSPDGMRVAVAMQARPPAGDPPADAPLELMLLPVGPGAPLPAYGDNEVSVGRSVFLSDGSELIVTLARSGPGGRQGLYRLDLLSGQTRALTGAPEGSYDPALLPDGSWLVFAAPRHGRTDIFALPLTGDTPVRLTDQGAVRAPVIAPDGRLLAFLAIAPGEPGFDLWIAELSSEPGGALAASRSRRLTSGMGIDADSGLAWAP